MKIRKKKSWIFEGIAWGIFMFLATGLLFPLIEGTFRFTWRLLYIHFPMWIGAGVLFSHWNEKRRIAELERRNKLDKEDSDPLQKQEE